MFGGAPDVYIRIDARNASQTQVYSHAHLFVEQACRALARGVLMAWQCLECTRFWGHCHKHCILCRLRLALRMSLRQKVAVATVRALILQFAGSWATVQPLLKGRSMCSCFKGSWRCGTPRCCRCPRCRAPLNDDAPLVLIRLARKYGHGRTYLIDSLTLKPY